MSVIRPKFDFTFVYSSYKAPVPGVYGALFATPAFSPFYAEAVRTPLAFGPETEIER